MWPHEIFRSLATIFILRQKRFIDFRDLHFSFYGNLTNFFQHCFVMFVSWCNAILGEFEFVDFYWFYKIWQKNLLCAAFFLKQNRKINIQETSGKPETWI